MAQKVNCIFFLTTILFFFFLKKKHHSWATSLSQGFPRSEALAVIVHDRYCFPHFIKGGTERPAGLFEPVAICLPAATLSDRCGRLHPHAGLGWSPPLQTRAENGRREKALWFARRLPRPNHLLKHANIPPTVPRSTRPASSFLIEPLVFSWSVTRPPER